MVQRSISDMAPHRPTGTPSDTIHSSNDDSNWIQRFSLTEDDPHAVSMRSLQALMDHGNIQACEITYRVSSGKAFQVTRTHPEPREVLYEDSLTRRLSRSSADTLEDFDHEDNASRSGQARGLSRAGRRGPPSKRKRGGSSSPAPASRTKRKTVRNRRAAVTSGYNSDSEDEEDELEGAETESLPIRIADVHGLYYDVAFRSISQLCCKDIAKAWIKICHPRKQTSHPYNGGKSSNVEISLAEYGYKGHFTKPDYWPSDENWPVGLGCRHVEPDHVKKPERLLLLLYLIRIQYKDFKDGDFTLEKMRQSTEGIHLEFPKNWTTKCVERLKEIYRIRETEMEFERGEIDADTLVYPQMPKPRCKAVRKAPNKLAPKLGIKAASAPSEQLKNESEDKSPGLCNTPGDEDLDLSEGSESSTYADTSSSTKEISLDESYAKRISCDARTIQDGLPFSNSPSPMDRIHNPVQENWTLQTANLGRDTPIMTQRNSFGCVATPGGAQRSLPLRDQHGVGSSSMQTFPSQEVRRRRYDHDSAASQQAANRMRPNGRFTRAPAARLVAPKVETICPQTFAASSSGLVGAFPTDTDYSSWQNLWNAQLEPSMYTAVADPSASLIPSTNGSFSSGYSDASFSSGLHSNGGSQNIMPPYQQGFDEEFLQHLNLQRISIPGYQPLGVNTPSSGNPDMSNRYPYTTDFHTEHKFDPFSQHQRQL